MWLTLPHALYKLYFQQNIRRQASVGSVAQSLDIGTASTAQFVTTAELCQVYNNCKSNSWLDMLLDANTNVPGSTAVTQSQSGVVSPS